MSSEPSPAESQARSGRDVLKGRDDGRRRELRIAARRERPRSQPPAPGSQGTGPPQGRRLGGHCPCFVRHQSSCVPASGDFRMALSVGVGSAPADPFGRAPRRQVGSPPVLSTTSSTRIGRAPFVDRSMNADVSMRGILPPHGPPGSAFAPPDRDAGDTQRGNDQPHGRDQDAARQTENPT
jgi:hypothetical protein